MSSHNEDPRVSRTRKALRMALLELMRTKDFFEITIRELTDEAEISRGTFYRYYATTADLLHSLTQEVFGDYVEACERIRYRDKTLRSGVEQRCLVFYTHVAANRDFYVALLGVHGLPQFQKVLQDMRVERFRKRYSFETPDGKDKHIAQVRFNLLANYIVYAQLGLAQYWLLGDLPLEIGAVARMAAEFTYTLLSAQREWGLQIAYLK